MAISSWGIGEPVKPGTSGGMFLGDAPVDPAKFALKPKILDGEVHFLTEYFLEGSSIHPQNSLSGSFAMTLYHTDPDGKYLGEKWCAKLRTGNTPVEFENVPDDSNEEAIPEFNERPWR